MYVSCWKPSRSNYLSARGAQFSGAPEGAQLCLKPGSLYFQFALPVYFPCSEFSRLIITAAYFFFPSVCYLRAAEKIRAVAGTLLGGLFAKKNTHISVTASKSHYWDNYKMFMKHLGDVLVETTRSFSPSNLQQAGSKPVVPKVRGGHNGQSGFSIILEQEACYGKVFFFITFFKNACMQIKVWLFNKWVWINIAWTWSFLIKTWIQKR